MKYIKLHILLIIIGLAACDDAPDNPDADNDINKGTKGAFVMCEGLWGMDNASIVKYDADSESFSQDFYANANPGFHLGDVANDLVIRGDTAFVLVSVSKTLELFRVSDGEQLGRIIFNSGSMPRKLCIVNDSIAYVSDLNNHCIIKVNYRALEILEDVIPVGPAPEGLAYYQGKLFIANSGAGDLLYEEENAGTIFVLDMESQSIEKIPGLFANVSELLINEKNNKLYAAYYHLHKYADSLAGIAEIDLNTYKTNRIWRDSLRHITLSPGSDSIIYISNDEIKCLRISDTDCGTESIITNPNSDEFWYSAAISPYDNSLWVGNALNYQVNGKLEIYDISGEAVLLNTVTTGINPGKIVFF